MTSTSSTHLGPPLRRAWTRARLKIEGRGRHGPLAPHDRWPALARFDREVAARTDALNLGRPADATLRGLSRLADHSVLWVGVGAGLAATGPVGRRAALRGATTLLAASAVANLVAKPLFGGERPTTSGLDVLRRLADSPTSGSFPSGHSASAAAFTLGVATEWPAAGAALAPLAAAVAYSRMHVGAHWFSDVAGGVAIGVGAAVLGRRLFPPEPRTTEFAPAPPTDVPALDDGDGLFVLVNPKSGKAGGQMAQAIREALPAAEVHELSRDDDVGRLVSDALRSGSRAVGVSGGDGTVGSVAAAARAHGSPLVVFPGGTLNHFAKALRIAGPDVQDPVGLVARSVRTGQGVAVDVGDLEVGGTEGGTVRWTVLNTFSLGAYPDIVAHREKLEGKLGKQVAAIVATAQTFPRAKPVPVRGAVEDSVEPRDVWSLFAGIDRYTPPGPAPARRTRLDDGLLDVRVALARKRRSTVRVLARSVFDQLGSPLARRIPRTRSWLGTTTTEVPVVDVLVPAGTTLAHDGETHVVGEGASSGRGAADVRVQLTLRPGALRVYAPAEQRPDDGS